MPERPPDLQTENDTSASGTGQSPPEALETPTSASDPAPSAADGSLADTTGTGTIVALGCIGATAFLIVLGLLYLLFTQLFG